MITRPLGQDEWQCSNSEYLGALLADLRRRLEAATSPPQHTAVSAGGSAGNANSTELARPAASGPIGFFRWATQRATSSAAERPQALLSSRPTILLGPGTVPSDDIASRLAKAATADPPPALLMLAHRLGLSDFEREVLLLCLAPELDTGIAAMCAAVQQQPERDYPSFALAMAISQQPAWEAVSPERPLRHWRLIEVNQPPGRALTASALRADERIVNFVKGLNHLDDRLAPLVLAMPPVQIAELPPSQRTHVQHLSRAMAARASRSGDDGQRSAIEPLPGQATSAAAAASVAVLLHGRDLQSKCHVAGAWATAVGLQLYRLPADALPTQAAELEQLARLWHRESLLLPLALYIDAHEVDRNGGPEGLVQRIGRFAARTGGVVFIDTRDGLPLPMTPLVALDIAKPTAAEQFAAWHALVGDVAPELPARLAEQFDLNQPDIAAISQAVAPDIRKAPIDALALQGRVWRACLERTRPQLARLADKLDVKATWDQLVLPAAEAAQLRQIAAQVRGRGKVYDDWGFRARMNRGLGVSVLFAGESGTGKTMAAEVLANALELDLYRIDLSAVVSKYIGETEKNLREVFDAAECGGAILFFDEADALFGKRSEVKDSHDRYANIEIDYLLQRLEAFGGLAILATNMKSALDTGFIRRLRFVVDFPFPVLAQRRLMWECAFPPETPMGVIDHDRLARLNLTGGNIHSMALNAAFMAAEDGTPVTMGLLMEAGRTELRKLGMPVNAADFRWIDKLGTGI